MKRFFLAIFFCAFAPILALAQSPCGPGGCAVAQTGWRAVDGAQYYYSAGHLIGAYQNGEWYPFNGRMFGLPTTPPWVKTTKACKCSVCKCGDCKCGQKFSTQRHVYADNTPLFGVMKDRLHKDGKCHYRLNGREVQKHEAMAALQLTDDSAKPFITFIGTGCKEKAAQFITTPEAAKCRVNAYDATDWHVSGGFVTSGSPTVYVQSAKGEVLYRGDNPPVDVIQAEARKAQPDYDPAKDPTGAPDVIPWLKQGSIYAVFGVIVGLIYYLKRS